jgi:putative transposase
MIIRKAFKFHLKSNRSRRCPLRHHSEKDNRKSQTAFVCLKCGFKENADDTAAINILAAGQAVSACGDIGPVTGQAQESPLL